MRPIMILLMLFLLLQLPTVAGELRVGAIDLAMAASLHPRLALFDFDRMGFYKVDMGLTQEDFAAAVSALKSTPAVLEKGEELRRLEGKLRDIDREKSLLLADFSGLQPVNPAEAQNALNVLAAEEARLNAELADLRFAVACPELTDPAATRQILDEIEREILATVRAVAASGSYDLILNSSIPVPYGYPVRYQAGEMYGQGIPGINASLFYAFLAKNNLAHPLDETPPSRELINWLELTHFPDAVNLLPMRPYPLVLSGAENILSPVMQQIYASHQIKPEVFKVVDSVIHKIEELMVSTPSVEKH